ncbi:MAG: DUF4124 domain-containing protein [Rhodanobacter sp.]
MQRSLLVVVLLLLAPVAFAQVYKWTDAGGTVHYSETPPSSGTNYKQIKTSGNAEAIAAPAPAATDADKTAAGTPPVAPAKPVADTPENRAVLCASLKTNLDALRGSEPVVMQKDGKPVALDDSQRQAQMASAQGQYLQYCQSH